MASFKPDQLMTDADGATGSSPAARAVPEPGRYEIDTSCSAVRNATMPVSLSIEHSAVTPRSFNVRATTRIDRNEFGVTGYRGLAARYLDMTVEVRCVRS